MEIKAIGCEPLSLKRVFIKDGHTLKVYQETGGYVSLKKALGMSQDEIIQQQTLSRFDGSHWSYTALFAMTPAVREEDGLWRA